jgi:hypothetical protein
MFWVRLIFFNYEETTLSQVNRSFSRRPFYFLRSQESNFGEGSNGQYN